MFRLINLLHKLVNSNVLIIWKCKPFESPSETKYKMKMIMLLKKMRAHQNQQQIPIIAKV